MSTGLAFKQTSDSVVLFVVTTETVLAYNTSAKDRRVSIRIAFFICSHVLASVSIFKQTGQEQHHAKYGIQARTFKIQIVSAVLETKF